MIEYYELDKYAEDLEVRCELCGYPIQPPADNLEFIEEWQHSYCSEACYKMAVMLDEESDQE